MSGEEVSKTEGPRAYARAGAGPPKLEVHPNPEAVAAAGARRVAEAAREAVRERGRFTLAVSGGHTPWAMFGRLANEEMPWEETGIFQVDERVAPAGDEERNLTHLLGSLPTGGRAEIHGMPVEAENLQEAAEAYAAELPESFDLIHLGLGADGHTASLVPGDAVLEVSDRDVGLTGVYRGRRRMTLTYPVLERARGILWLVTGAEKKDALRRLLAGDGSIPAGRVASERAVILADRAAAG